jgi:hypothetical protein
VGVRRGVWAGVIVLVTIGFIVAADQTTPFGVRGLGVGLLAAGVALLLLADRYVAMLVGSMSTISIQSGTLQFPAGSGRALLGDEMVSVRLELIGEVTLRSSPPEPVLRRDLVELVLVTREGRAFRSYPRLRHDVQRFLECLGNDARITVPIPLVSEDVSDEVGSPAH